MRLLVTVRTEARSNFAAQHLAAAEYFVSQVAAAELVTPPSKEVFAPADYLHCWFASIVFAVMALEANVYELMTVADRGEDSPIGRRRFRTEDMRKSLLDRYSLLYQVAKLGTRLPLDQGVAQEVRALVSLRDEVVHYKTEWRSSQVVSKKLEVLLRTRIPPNPYKCGDVFFPEQCVSFGSAQWAVDTARRFIKDFSTETGFRSTV